MHCSIGSIKRVERTCRIQTVDRVTSNNGRASDLRRGSPAQAQVRSRPDHDLTQPIAAGHEYLRAKRGSPTIGTANMLYLSLATYTTQCISVEQIAQAGLAICKDQSSRQENRSHRS